MQLFGLVNVALSRDIRTAKRDLFIEQYPVIPLSDNAGLIGWVDNAETLHVLIRDYRKQTGVDLLGIEHQYMTNTMTSEYDKLCLMQKVEVFEAALEKTDGTDLKRIMWQSSQNSEVWLDRRTMYIRSLATMSMVGYILGLGDRHPSNVMLDSTTGKVVHIDFGDCFEVAMSREIFPEKIPFRLTRMLVSAMEVCGIDGLFRNTCDLVMSLLRKERESVKALLEAFAHDPLVNWRLLETKKVDPTAQAPAPDRKMKRIDKMDTLNNDGGWENSAKYSRSCFEKSVREGKAAPDRDASQHKAQEVITRISAKLEGKEFMTDASGPPSSATPVNGSFIGSPTLVDHQPNLSNSFDIRARQDSYIDTQARILHQLKKSGVRSSSTAVILDHTRSLTVPEQVDMLIRQATSHENLCQCYLGWCPFW
jgi:FKBP12-rapamycin complex-associated protein